MPLSKLLLLLPDWDTMTEPANDIISGQGFYIPV